MSAIVGEKAAVGDEHRVARLVPRNGALLDFRAAARCGPNASSLSLPNHLRLQRVIAVRQARIGLAHRRDQRLHHLALDPVGQMAGSPPYP